jgi:MFS superfamily sulfate permease-like transporter
MQVTHMEFILLWASFLIIMATDLQRGIVIGIVLAVLYFAWSYAQVGLAGHMTILPFI